MSLLEQTNDDDNNVHVCPEMMERFNRNS